MKKGFTLFLMFAALLAANAQQAITTHSVDKSDFNIHNRLKKVTSTPKKQIHRSSRSASNSFMIDYPSVDEAYSVNIGTDFYYVDFLNINKNYANTDDLTHRYAIARFDTLLYIDQNTQLPAFVPRASTSLTLDSLDVFFIHNNTTGNYDTIKFTVYDSLWFTGNNGAAIVRHNTDIWDTTIIVNSTIPLNVDNGGTPTFTDLTFYPNLSFAQGKTFGVTIDFAGDTANHFDLIAGFRDDCAQACLAAPTVCNLPSPALPNAVYYVNATSQGQNLSGINSIEFQCGPPCAEWYPQNWWVYPSVTATTTYSAAITEDSLTGCPGTVLNFTGWGFGSSATPYTYAWNTTSGTLTQGDDPSQQYFTIDGNATVTLTVTDAANVSATATVNVVSRGIGVTFSNPTPISIACGDSVTLSTAITGTQTGRTYTWSNSQWASSVTGATRFSYKVGEAGTYKVSVVNSYGCTAAATAVVSYQNGVTNSVSFSGPSNPVEYANVTYANSSTYQSGNGWSASWNMGDNSPVITTADAQYAYPSLGSYYITLTEDSAGCNFSYSRAITVQSPTGIQETVADFGDAITLQPNPSSGNILLTISNAEKNVSIKVYNIIGSEVKEFYTGDAASNFTKSFDFADLSSGTYLMKIQSASKVAVKRFTISK